jgi:hypothetical protein
MLWSPNKTPDQVEADNTGRDEDYSAGGTPDRDTTGKIYGRRQTIDCEVTRERLIADAKNLWSTMVN